MRLLIPLVVPVLLACDRPPSPAAPRAPQGVLRIDRSGRLAGELLDPKPNPGYPSLVVTMSYAGPKTRLQLQHEGWHQGKRTGSGTNNASIHLPLSNDAAFGLSDGTSPEGKEVPVLHESLPAGPKVSDRIGGARQYAMPPLKMRSKRVHEPAWPLEVRDGGEAIVWAVFVDEPADVPAGATVEERARRADAAWILRIRTTDEKK